MCRWRKNLYSVPSIHRAENTDDLDRLKNIISALNIIAETTDIVMPVHPRTRKIIKEHALQTHFRMIDPVGYLEMVYLLEKCKFVMTDSGGLQKEAFFFKKPCLTLRDETEWVELVENGFNELVGADKEKIIDRAKSVKEKNIDFSMNLYGQGHASEMIVNALLDN